MRFSRPTKLLALVGAAAVVGSLAPAGAAVAPRFASQRTYVHCGAAPKASVIDYATTDKVPTWNTTEPTVSFQQGAGCGSQDTPVLGFAVDQTKTQPLFDMVWEGRFTGNLDSMTIHAHSIWMGPGKITEQAIDEAFAALTVDLWVDGQNITLGPLDDQGNQAVSPTVIKSSTGISSEFVFTIDDLNFVDPVVDADLDGVADNAGTTEHTVRLALHAYSLDNPLMVWVWDAKEVPSGIEFNPATLATPILKRQP